MELQTWYKRYLEYKTSKPDPYSIRRLPNSEDLEIVSKLLNEHGIKEIRCLSCGAKLGLVHLKWWGPHPSGVNGKWFYFHCPICGYDTSLEKVLIKRIKKR